MQSFGKVCKGELIHIKIKKKYKRRLVVIMLQEKVQ